MTATSFPALDLVGAVLNRKYPLKRVIGAGSMGTVYESQSEEGRPLAVKVLAVDYLHDDDVKGRFVEEGRMCQRLIHPSIVRVFDAGQAEDGTPFIVMELLEGVPLSAYTRANVRVPLAQASTILQGILAGLGAAHAQGIVHRDLKPENVFLARESTGSGAFAPKILDFGIAKVMDVAGGMGSKTSTGIMLGTPAYMSPEQIKNSKDVDARTDLWSAGVLLYEMLTGRVAFPAPNEYARLSAVLSTTPLTLEQIDPQLSRLSAFVQLSMQKDRAQRFQSALEMARALAASVGLEPHVAPLSRLPDVPSMFAAHLSQAVTSHPGSTITAQSHHPPSVPAQAPSTEKGPGGTLASPAGMRVSDRPTQVHVMTGAQNGTLPSEHLPMLSPYSPGARSHSKRGIAIWIVVVLGFLALLVGWLLGLVTARLL